MVQIGYLLGRFNLSSIPSQLFVLSGLYIDKPINPKNNYIEVIVLEKI